MVSSVCSSLYKVENGVHYFYDISSKSYQVIPGTETVISLDTLITDKTIWRNEGDTIVDLGGGILNLEFQDDILL